MSSTTSTVNLLGINCCPQLNKNCCKVTITVEDVYPNVVVTVKNGGCYTIQPFLRFGVGPVAKDSATLVEGDYATILYYEQATNTGNDVVVRYNKSLRAGEEVTFVLNGSFGNPIQACIQCFVPEVTSRCHSYAAQQQDKLRSMARGVNCCLDICSESLCYCNKFILEGLNKLYRLNVLNGQAKLLGTTSELIKSLAVNPLTGVLYTLKSDGSKLLTLNTLTLQTTVIGSTNAGSVSIFSLAFNSSGELYGFSSNATSDLYKFNLSTGAMTKVGVSGFGAITTVAIAFNENDDLFLKYGDSLFTNYYLTRLDAKTGLPIGSPQLLSPTTNNLDGNSLQFICTSRKNPYQIIENAESCFLQSIDPITGTVTTITSITNQDAPFENLTFISAFSC